MATTGSNFQNSPPSYSSRPHHYLPASLRRTLPPINSNIERKMCVGRVWIFLVLGVLLLVLGLVTLGIYLNMAQLTTSLEYTQILPHYVPAGAVLLAGLGVTCLFWKRYNVMVMVVVVISVVVGLFSLLVAVLMFTHVLPPLTNFTRCRFYQSQTLCQCFSPYRRDLFILEYSATEESKYDFESVTACDDIESVIPRLLYAFAVILCLVFIVCIVSAILALLVLRAERNKRGYIGADSYEEVYTVSGSSQDPSDSEGEVTTEVITSPQGRDLDSKNSIPTLATRGSVSTEGSLSRGYSREGNVFQGVGKSSSIDRRSQTPHLTVPRTPINLGQRSKTPGPYELGRENLANRYMINKEQDREFNVRQRLSKTPDRELTSARRNSLTSVKRISKSCESLDSTGKGGKTVGRKAGTEGRKSKLKEHRKKGKRAATVHNLDTEQLLLILNLQMRYLQESKEQEQNQLKNQNGLLGGSARRAITPQPPSQKSVIPQKIRSHTPQPRRATGRIRDSQSLYAQNLSGNVFQRQRLRSDGGSCVSNSANSSRRTSESSDKHFDFGTNSTIGTSGVNGEFVYYQGLHGKLGADNYPRTQQMCHSTPRGKDGHNPYIHTQFQKSSPDNAHYVTYSDSMLNSPNKPRSRPSAQNYTLPPKPLQRSSHQQLPPQPISRQKIIERQLPPQPVHRGNSAFHVVDRASKSRSPSVNNSIASSDQKLQNDFAEVAIRENFSLNTKEKVVQGENDNGNPNSNFILRGRETESGEVLPPYSGPPSYKEYVSSCNTSVTSSLSSNPDDVYGMPRRRVWHDAVITENGRPTNQKPANQKVAGQMYKLTGATNSGFTNRREAVNKEENGHASQNSHHSNGYHSNERVPDQQQEVIYSSPARSKVKQCIVPEDYYYTTIAKTQRSDRTYANDNVSHAPQPTTSQNTGQVENMVDPDYRNMPVSNDQSSSQNLSGYQFKTGPGQIGPDAKYSNNYEDVYDTILPQNGALEGETVVKAPNKSSKSLLKGLKSPKKQKRANPVSDVFANNGSSIYQYEGNTRGVAINSQVTDCVENVHAENVGNIPQIKLTDHNPAGQNVIVRSRDETMEDDVFEDEAKIYNSNLSSAKPVNQVRPQQTTNSTNQNYHEINDLDVVNGDYANRHTSTDSSNQETDTGYMKMTLPGKLPHPTTENYGIAIHLTGHATNQNLSNGHVTTESTNQNARQVPDGEDNQEEDSQEYEETGV